MYFHIMQHNKYTQLLCLNYANIYTDYIVDPNDSTRGFIYIGQLNPTELGDFCEKKLPWPGKVPTINTQQRLSLLQAQPINGDFYIGLYKENSDEICLGYDQCSSCMYSSFFLLYSIYCILMPSPAFIVSFLQINIIGQILAMYWVQRLS